MKRTARGMPKASTQRLQQITEEHDDDGDEAVRFEDRAAYVFAGD